MGHAEKHIEHHRARIKRPGENASRRNNIVTEGHSGQHLTVADLCAELDISRSTFYEWRAKKTAPRCIKLPNGAIRVRRADLDAWLESQTEQHHKC